MEREAKGGNVDERLMEEGKYIKEIVSRQCRRRKTSTIFYDIIHMKQASLMQLTACDAEPGTEHEGVTKIEARLEEARHFRLDVVVVHRVEEHVDGSRGGRRKGCPLPVVVLRIKEEVGPHDGDTDRDDDEDEEDEEHEAIDVVHLRRGCGRRGGQRVRRLRK